MIIKDYFNKENELDPVRRDVEELVDELANKLYEAKKIKGIMK